MASAEQARGESAGSNAVDTEAPRPSVSADVSAIAGSMKSPMRDLLIRICTPLPLLGTPGIPKSPEGSDMRDAEYDCHFQPARCSSSIILFTKPYSAAGSVATANAIPENGLIFSIISSPASSLITRGVIFLSSCATFRSAVAARASASRLSASAPTYSSQTPAAIASVKAAESGLSSSRHNRQ
jgi:hypothetical protein